MKTLLQIDQFLPDVPNAEDACVQRLIGSLKGRSGIRRVYIAGMGPAASLCIHAENAQWDRERLIRVVTALAEQLMRRIGHFQWHLRELSTSLLEEAAQLLRSKRGVLEAHVDSPEEITIEYLRAKTSPDAIRMALRESGIKA